MKPDNDDDFSRPLPNYSLWPFVFGVIITLAVATFGLVFFMGEP